MYTYAYIQLHKYLSLSISAVIFEYKHIMTIHTDISKGIPDTTSAPQILLPIVGNAAEHLTAVGP